MIRREDVSDSLRSSLPALAEIERTIALMPSGASQREIEVTLVDIHSMASRQILLGQDLWRDIHGRVRASGEALYKKQAIDLLVRAADAWRRYTASGASRYRNPLWTNRVGYVD